jgi:phage terminase large subunit-like protein
MREHEKNDRVPYSEWHRLGLVRATEGNVIDYDRIFRDIRDEIVRASRGCAAPRSATIPPSRPTSR